MSVGSPFTASLTEVTRLSDIKLGQSDLTIRVGDDTETDRIIIKTDRYNVVDPTHANFYLKAGESITFKRGSVYSAADITILSTSGTPLVYWGIT